MISGIFTLTALIGFIGVTWWAYARHNRSRFEEASMLPLSDETVSAVSPKSKEMPSCCKGVRS